MPYERRQFVRVGFDAPASLRVDNAIWQVKVIDLSLKGALVQLPTGAVVPALAGCRLALPLIGQLGEITMAMQVAHVEGDVLGLLSKHSDIDSITHLRRVIELQLGDPALLERDLRELIGTPDSQ